jgi:leucyl aminopeptidase
MIPKLIAAAAENPVNQIADDELLIVLGPADGKRSQWIEDLKTNSNASQSKSQFYSKYSVGFQGASGAKPYIIISWTKPGANALERRYVANRLCKFVKGQFNLKKVVFYLEQGSKPEHMAMVEDFIMSNTSPRFDRCHWTSVKVLTADQSALVASDPHRENRFRSNIGYRTWINMNPDEMTSIKIGQELEAFAKKKNLMFESLDERQLAKKGLNLLVAVGQASELSPSRLHLVSSNVQPGDKPLLLVGKGVTFDTGGINVKPHLGFVNCMKNDMGGAALMCNLFMAMVESGYKGPLALAIPCCENLVAQKSMKPGAIVKAYNGKDVMIEHTDAEGRLILADALTYSCEKWKPSKTIVAATLTTAALKQFTNYFTPVHFADDDFADNLTASSRKWGEGFTFWDEFLPFAQGNRSQAADLTNMGRMPSHASMGGGSNVAAHFLKEFVDGPLIHVDIFASTWNWSGDYPGSHYGATGAPFNSLFDSLMN